MTLPSTPGTSAQSTAANAASRRQPSPLLLAVGLAAMLLVWCFNYTAGKIALRHIDPLSLASIRIELATVLMLGIYFLRRDRSPLCRRDIWTFTYLGFLGVVLNQGFYTVGLNYTTSERSVLIVALAPILVLLFARIMKLEAFTPAKIVGMGIAFLGVLLLEADSGSSGHTPWVVGDVITFIGVAGFAVYSVLGKKVLGLTGPGKYDTVSFNTFTLVASAVMLLPLAVRQGIKLDWKSVGWAGWAGLAYMAVFSSVAAYTLFYWLLRHMEPSRVAAVNYLQPFIVILLSIVFLGEHPTGHLLSGGALVVIGVYLAERVSQGSMHLEKRKGPET